MGMGQTPPASPTPPPPTFALIVGTLGRIPELRRLLASLEAQTFRDFEILLIDQSGGEAVADAAAPFAARGLRLRRVPAPPGLSAARNRGLALTQATLVAFPDDDAWYPPDLLAQVAARLTAPGAPDGLSCRVTDEAGVCSAGGWMSAARMPMTRANIWRTAVSCSFFLWRDALGGLRFDARLGAGAGTPMGSGEETDFLLRLLAAGRRLDYDGTLTVLHPVFRGPWRAARGWRYGVGHGWVLRTHGFGAARGLWAVALQGVRAAQAALTLRPRKACFHLAQAAGRAWGFLRAKRAPGWAAPLAFAAAAFAAAALCACLWNLSNGDTANRYALMAEAFAQGDWGDAFHPRFNLLFPVGAGTLVWLFGCDGATACSLLALLGWAAASLPLFAIAQSLFGRGAAWCAFALSFAAPTLFDMGYEGFRDTFRTLACLLALQACLDRLDRREGRGLLAMAVALPLFATTRGDTILLGAAAWALYALLGLRRRATWAAAAVYALALQPGCWLTWAWMGQWLPSGQIASAFARLFGGGGA